MSWGGAGAVVGVEVCAPLALLCWVCCWTDDTSDTSSGRHPARPVITSVAEHGRGGTRARSLGAATSAVSLHLPTTSGSFKQSLSAPRSTEQLVREDLGSRYHSAPSVIHEVVHRRDWGSSRDLYLPLRPPADLATVSDEHLQVIKCKKHHTNIKSSKKKELDTEVKDTDVTETSFYIGDNDTTQRKEDLNVKDLDSLEEIKDNDLETNVFLDKRNQDLDKDVDSTDMKYKPKETKQSVNESIKSREKRLIPVSEFEVSEFEVDRSGAVHHSAEPPGLYDNMPAPPASVETVGYEAAASYLQGALWGEVVGAGMGVGGAGAVVGDGYVRARHASAGDVLAPVFRPQSGAFSESELELELESCNEPPPPYSELHPHRKETAI